MSKIILANLPAPPPSPAPGTIAVYAQGDTLFSINSSGVVSSLGGGGGVTVSAATDQGLSVTGGPAYSLALSVPSQTTGTIIYRNGSNQWVGLNPGSNGQVLTLAGGVPTWAAAGGGGVTINTAAPLTGGAGPATTFNLGFKFVSQQPGDMAILDDDGVTWQRLARGVGASPTDPFALFDAGGAVSPATPTNGVQWASAAFLKPQAGNGIGVTGTTVRIAFPGEASGDMIFNNAGTWDRLAAGIVLAGSYLKVDATGLPAWDLDLGVTDIYVNNDTGSDANNGLTPLTAVQTLDRAMQLVPRGSLKRECTIHCEGNTPILAKTSVPQPHWMIPTGGPQSYMLTIDANLQILFASGLLTTTGGTQGTTSAFGTITFSGTPLPAGTLQGKVLRCISMFDTNFVAGECFRIHSNTNNTITIVGMFPGPITVGDTVEVGEERIIEFPAKFTDTDVPVIMGGPLLLSGVKLDIKDNAMELNSVSLFTNVAAFTGNPVGGGRLKLTRSQIAGIKAPSSIVRGLVFTAALEANRYCGPTFLVDAYGQENSSFDLTGVYTEVPLFAQNGSSMRITGIGFGVKGRAVVERSSAGDFSQAAANSTSATSSAMFLFRFGSSGSVTYVDANNYDGAVAEALEHSNVQALSWTGTVSLSAYAAKANNHSRIVVPDANTGTTVVGTGGAGAAVVVGGNAPTSWALIAGMATVDVVDLAATPPTFSAITTA